MCIVIWCVTGCIANQINLNTFSYREILLAFFEMLKCSLPLYPVCVDNHCCVGLRHKNQMKDVEIQYFFFSPFWMCCYESELSAQIKKPEAKIISISSIDATPFWLDIFRCIFYALNLMKSWICMWIMLISKVWFLCPLWLLPRNVLCCGTIE